MITLIAGAARFGSSMFRLAVIRSETSGNPNMIDTPKSFASEREAVVSWRHRFGPTPPHHGSIGSENRAVCLPEGQASPRRTRRMARRAGHWPPPRFRGTAR